MADPAEDELEGIEASATPQISTNLPSPAIHIFDFIIKSSKIVLLIQNYPRFYPTHQYKLKEKGAPVIHIPASLNSHKVPSSDPTFCHPQTQATLQLWVVLFGAKDFETKVNVYLYFLFTNNAVVVEYLLSLVGSFSKGRKLMTDNDWKV